MGERVAIFIDGGYLDSALIKFGKARIDYEKMVNALSENFPLLRAFVDARKSITQDLIDEWKR